MCVYVCVCVCVFMFVCVCVNTHTRARAHTHTHTHTAEVAPIAPRTGAEQVAEHALLRRLMVVLDLLKVPKNDVAQMARQQLPALVGGVERVGIGRQPRQLLFQPVLAEPPEQRVQVRVAHQVL